MMPLKTLVLSVLVFATVFCSDSFCKEIPLQKEWVCYMREDYAGAIEACRAYTGEDNLDPEQRYLMALSFLKLGNIEEAQKNLLFIADNYPDSALKEDIILSLADSYYLAGKFETAEEYYKKLLDDFPDTAYASIAYLRLGETQRKLGAWKDSSESFRKVTDDYPFSLEADSAKDYLRKEEHFFTIQVGVFAKKGNAQRISTLLNEKGYVASAEKFYSKDKLMYRVTVGNFESEAEAEKEAARLKEDGFSARISP
jgi:tetratricopeptide (TPR) repeat protein